MQITKDTAVAVHYKLFVDGNEVDASGDQALTYLHGHGMMIPGFEKNLSGKNEGDTYDFVLEPADAYGEYRADAVVDLDKEMFLIDGVMSTQVFVGAQLQMTNQEGHPLVGVVAEISEDKVKMDFNHQLAGKQLHFTGNVESVRKATDEEISHGHVHGPDGHHH